MVFILYKVSCYKIFIMTNVRTSFTLSFFYIHTNNELAFEAGCWNVAIVKIFAAWRLLLQSKDGRQPTGSKEFRFNLSQPFRLSSRIIIKKKLITDKNS